MNILRCLLLKNLVSLLKFRTSHWEYSGCLLGIYSAKLTWRSCHGSYKDKIRTVTRTHQEANLGNNTRGRRKQVIKSQRDHLCWDVKWACQVEGVSREDSFKSPWLLSWGRMAWSVESRDWKFTIHQTIVQEPLYLFFYTCHCFSSDFNKCEQTIWTILYQNSQIHILLFHCCSIISLYWLWFVSFHSSKSECFKYSSHTFLSFEGPWRKLWLI